MVFCFDNHFLFKSILAGCDTAAQSKAKLAKEVILRSRRRLCNNCTGGPTNLQSCRPQLRWRRRLLSPPFLVMTGGCRQAGVLRRKSRDISPVMTVINLEPSLSPPLVSQCQKSDIIKETLRYYIVAWLPSFLLPPAGGSAAWRARRCRPAAAKAALDSCRQDFLEQSTSDDFIATSVQFLV